jgi:chloramphenicol 3-O-phosphotransferase
VDVVAESVNPLRASRDAWRDAALSAGARVVEVEVVCSDATEHRRRAEERALDIPGLTKPSWEQISNREYHSWERDRLVVDTAMLNIDESVQLVRETERLRRADDAPAWNQAFTGPRWWGNAKACRRPPRQGT